MKLIASRKELASKLCELAAGQVAVNPQSVTPESNLIADLAFDSLDLVEFTMTLEDEFDIASGRRRADTDCAAGSDARYSTSAQPGPSRKMNRSLIEEAAIDLSFIHSRLRLWRAAVCPAAHLCG